MPTPKLPLGATNTFASASAWVGIDGETCQSAILQTGVDFTISDGKVTYDGQSQSQSETIVFRT